MPSGRDEDIVWTGIDPLGRPIHDLQSVRDARERLGRHQGPDRLGYDEMHDCLTTPSFINASSYDETRETYYRIDPQPGKPPYQRVTVSFSDSMLAPDGVAISYSRYGKPTSGKRIYTAEEGQ